MLGSTPLICCAWPKAMICPSRTLLAATPGGRRELSAAGGRGALSAEMTVNSGSVLSRSLIMLHQLHHRASATATTARPTVSAGGGDGAVRAWLRPVLTREHAGDPGQLLERAAERGRERRHKPPREEREAEEQDRRSGREQRQAQTRGEPAREQRDAQRANAGDAGDAATPRRRSRPGTWRARSRRAAGRRLRRPRRSARPVWRASLVRR